MYVHKDGEGVDKFAAIGMLASTEPGRVAHVHDLVYLNRKARSLLNLNPWLSRIRFFMHEDGEGVDKFAAIGMLASTEPGRVAHVPQSSIPKLQPKSKKTEPNFGVFQDPNLRTQTFGP